MAGGTDKGIVTEMAGGVVVGAGVVAGDEQADIPAAITKINNKAEPRSKVRFKRGDMEGRSSFNFLRCVLK